MFAWVLRGSGMVLLTWFVVMWLSPGRVGRGNPMWLVFIAALVLSMIAKRIRTETSIRSVVSK